jgi:hypothetical protein
MKLRVVFVTVLMGLFVFNGSFAQTADAVKAEIPFDFYVGTHKMTAGTYLLSLDPLTHRVDISGLNTKDRDSAMGIPTNSEPEPGSPSVEFDHLANDYFLKGVSTSEGTVNIGVTKAEQQIAGTTAGTTVVTHGN